MITKLGKSLQASIIPCFCQTLAKSTLRFCLGEDITKKDIDYVVRKLKDFYSKKIMIK